MSHWLTLATKCSQEVLIPDLQGVKKKGANSLYILALSQQECPLHISDLKTYLHSWVQED